MIQETSRMAYQSIEGELGRKQAQVFEFMLNANKPVCNLDIAKGLGIPINTVTPRVKELRLKGEVEEWGKETNPFTRRKVIYWIPRRGQKTLFV